MGGKGQSRWPKIAAVAALLAILLAPIAYANSGKAKQRYFEHTFRSCSRSAGLERAVWHQVSAFDGEVREFVAFDDREAAVIACVNRWAGLLISDQREPGAMQVYPAEARSKLTVAVSGENHAPPAYLVDIAHVEFTGLDAER
ncbi:hypothetical protein SZ64_12840 [Erythrobacter sp. SG61-1L]|uniref:hypothetical protein n=1 Tax=Erythrobacter sp. SG61-1L TaxID=1603897 RepID=UPI0006C8FA6D|nr:hypothetical protein [Erythrobacter sp. SG61-1L]KPL68905.1 hypothetical protein SZ64_12840 [Erythrobacter sp. SG61-1L]